MRVMGFTKKWPKLQQKTFTTFRVPRRDTDWRAGESVQVVYHPRSKDREFLFNAEIISTEPRTFIGKNFGLPQITDKEAVEDGFTSREDMMAFMQKSHREESVEYLLLKKLTLKRL